MLYCLDVDGTLVQSFLRDGGRCDRCHGRRVVAMYDGPALGPAMSRSEEAGRGREVPCPDCVASYDRVELLPGRAGVLWRLARQPGARFALVTNQGGVAFGYQTKEQVGRKLAAVASACDFFYGKPFTVHVAFGHPNATIDEYRAPELVEKRKPGPRMLYDALRAHDVHAHQAVYVGDMDTDLQCAEAAGVTFAYADDFFGPVAIA